MEVNAHAWGKNCRVTIIKNCHVDESWHMQLPEKHIIVA